MVGVVPTIVGVTPSMVGVIPTMVGVVPCIVWVVLCMVGAGGLWGQSTGRRLEADGGEAALAQWAVLGLAGPSQPYSSYLATGSRAERLVPSMVGAGT